MTEIKNKVASSGLLTLDLESFRLPGKRLLIDIRGWLFEELILKEKVFREKIKEHNWEQYRDAFVAITCSADAIVPTWAYMLIATELQPFAKEVYFGNLDRLESYLFEKSIAALDPEDYRDQRVVIKGCSTNEIPVSAYVSLTNFLRPVAKSIMYGEPCSTVPVFKQRPPAA